ncbi:hypothetical protein KBD61_01655 [Patescibacteria group bacterium]|nr:hypothetical protein [Patescibacteria group bacterium]MBP9709715.1 hypothetical protein [Patescibacteria group bacterium]
MEWSRIRSMLKKDAAWRVMVVCLALLFGIASVLPTLLFQRDRAYQGIDMMPYDAEFHYAARVQDVLDGHPALGNVFLPDKHLPYVQPPLPEISVAVLGKILGLSAVQALFLSQIVYGAGLFIMLVACFSVLVPRREAALMGAVLVCFGGFLPHDWRWLITLFRGEGIPEAGGLSLGRAIQPQWTVFWTAFGIYLLAKWVKDPRTRYLWGLATVLCVSVYSYVYTWSVLAVFIAIVVAVLWWQGRRISLKILLPLMAVTAIVLVPYLLNIWQLVHHRYYSVLASGVGVVMTHAPVFSLTTVAFFVVVIAAWKTLEMTQRLMLVAMGATWLTVINQQVITGRILQVGHYDWYFIKPFSFIACIGMVVSALLQEKRLAPFRRWTRVPLYFLSLFMVVAGFLYQIGFYRYSKPDWVAVQKGAGVITFLQRVAKKEEVVFTPHLMSRIAVLSDMIPVYTSANTYQSSNQTNYLASREELSERFFFNLWIMHAHDPTWRPDFSQPDLFHQLSVRVYGLQDARAKTILSQTQLREWEERYRQYAERPWQEKLARYQLDYLVLPLGIVPEGIGDVGKEIYKDADYRVYAVSSS